MSKEITKSDQLVSTVSKMRDQFKLALPSHIDPDKFIRVAQTQIRTNTTGLALVLLSALTVRTINLA